jgi:F-type H+-transporting ATPase subunit delta
MNATEAVPKKLHPTVLDVSVVQVARVYATALLKAAQTAGQLDAGIEEYESFIREVLDRNPNFEQMLQSSIIGRAEKGETLRKVFQGRASTTFLNFLFVLNEHLRLNLLRPALMSLKAIRDEELGLIPVYVRAAVPLDAASEKALRDRLAAIIAGQPVLHSEVDPELLGGLVIRVGDTVYDGSVRTHLSRLREQIIQRATHEIQSRRDQFSSAT